MILKSGNAVKHTACVRVRTWAGTTTDLSCLGDNLEVVEVRCIHTFVSELRHDASRELLRAMPMSLGLPPAAERWRGRGMFWHPMREGHHIGGTNVLGKLACAFVGQAPQGPDNGFLPQRRHHAFQLLVQLGLRLEPVANDPRDTGLEAWTGTPLRRAFLPEPRIGFQRAAINLDCRSSLPRRRRPAANRQR